MEVIQTPVITKTRSTRKTRLLEELTASGYQVQNAKLAEAGFVKISKNLRLLKKNNGDLETVLKTLQEKLAKKELRAQKRLEKAGDENKRSKRTKSEKPSRKTRKDKDLAESEDIASEKQIALDVPVFKKEKKVRKERRDKSENPEKKMKRERKGEEIVKKYEEFPAGIKTLYLDGNNMLFADNFLRKLKLNRKQKEAEEALSELASSFAVRLGNLNLVLVYDDIAIKCVKETLISADGKSFEFEILVARPKYSTSDDALVEWISNQSNPKECLIVTSDRGLQLRLKEKGVEHLMKSGNWFTIVKQVLGEEYTKIADKYNGPVDKQDTEAVKNN